MIVPSIDLMDGHAVQLVEGREKVIDAGDPRPIAERFRLAGEVAVIDLDAALGRGSNRDVILDLLDLAPCRVGGGIRSVEGATRWLDAGARKVILGTAATPVVLRALPKERVIAALDARHGDVVVEGWTKTTGQSIADRMDELAEHVGGFLVTFVEREGHLQGLDMSAAKALIERAGDARVTVAGGVASVSEIAAMDRLGADVQVGMALYSGRMDLGDAIGSPLTSDREDGLWPTVVVDELGVALGLAYSDAESLREAVAARCGAYHSRSRGLWIKGESSGARQELLRVDLDCDRDTLRFTVRQHGDGFCHQAMRTCWGEDRAQTRLARQLAARMESAPAGSYTARLFRDADLLRAKLVEEAKELGEAIAPEDVAGEAADVIYFTLVAMAAKGVSLADVADVLDKRALRVTRRPGNAKPDGEATA